MKNWIRTVAAAALAAGTLIYSDAPASSADLVYKSVPTDVWSHWMIRVRALAVVPQASATIDQVPGGSVSISNSIVPELDITYFFTKNIAAELILGVTPHDITGAGALTGTNVGRAWLLPPTLTLQYHFTDFGAFKPYVGIGLNYTVFFNQSAAGGTITQLTLKDTFGAAVQVGFDYMIDRHWGFNVDVKKYYLRPDVSMNNGALTGKVTIDPWLISAGITYRL